MSFSEEVIVTFISMAERLGWSDEELRRVAQALRQGKRMEDPDALNGLRIAKLYCDTRTRQAATDAFEVVSDQFASAEFQRWLVALQKVHLCIVPLYWR